MAYTDFDLDYWIAKAFWRYVQPMNKTRYFTFFLLALLSSSILWLSGCGGGGSTPPVGRGDGSWTVMVFLNGANDLDEFSDLNVNQMEESMLNPKVKVVVQWKRISSFAPPGSWTGTRRYLVKYDTNPNQINSQMVQDMGAGVDMGRPEALQEFVQWAKTNYPSDRYMLVIWNHGSGWRSRKSDTVTRAVSFDDETGSSIKIWELPQAIRPTESEPKMDVLAFDASLMQMLETVYECRNVAKYIVGSEESPPGEGYPYHRFLIPLAQNSDMTNAELASIIVNNTVDHYRTNFPFYQNITQSAVDTSKLDAVASALDNVAGVLISRRNAHVDALMNARRNAQKYSTYDDYKDLWHAMELAKQNTADSVIGTAVNQLQAAIGEAVIAEAHDNRRLANSHGLSIYYPSAGDYLNRYASQLALGRSTRWSDWLSVAP